MNGQAHVVSLARMVQRPGQSVTREMALADILQPRPRSFTAAGSRAEP
jgi:hypothetical protein